MRITSYLLLLVCGGALGWLAHLTFQHRAEPVLQAASNDRYHDTIMATGAVSLTARVQTDGVWLLDYRTGRLLGTVIDKTQGKIVGWAEVDLVSEFGIKPKEDVHFLMTTGYITRDQSALYLAETTTGKLGVYTMGPGANGQGIVIRRHDRSFFRQPAQIPGAQPGLPGGVPKTIPPIEGPPANVPGVKLPQVDPPPVIPNIGK